MKDEKYANKLTYVHTFRNVFFMLRYLLKYTPEYILISIIEVMSGAFWNVLSGVLFIKYLFESIELGADYKSILFVTIFVISYKVVLELFNKWLQNVYTPKVNLRLHEGMQSELYKKAMSLDLSYYDDPHFYNDYIWSIRESDTRVTQLVSDLKGFLNSIITTVGMFALFITIDWIVIIAVLLSTIFGLLIRNKLNKINYQKAIEMNQVTRRTDYIKRIFYLNDYSKELRIGKIGVLLEDEYEKATKEKIDCIKRYMPKILGISLLSQILTSFLFDAIVTGYLVMRYAMDESFSLGDFSASVNAIWKFFVQINAITNYVSRFNEHSIYIDKFKQFLECTPKILDGDKKACSFDLLEVNNVSFSYTNDKNYALKNISFTISKGEKVAFVGYNGAGKTTLTKILMRLYDATDGSIRYNGKDIKEYEISSYRKHIGAVFQDYKIFAATIYENVLGEEFCEEQKTDVLSALKAATFKRIDSLPNGINTMLTREFDKDGVNLSGGEIQKINIARVFANAYDLIIMDEPSSALDPFAEYELNNSICEIAKDKAMIFISHRLSTTRMVDRIYMFVDGEIVEYGSHDELMKLNGEYAKMFSAQASGYMRE